MTVPSPRRCVGCLTWKQCHGYDYYAPFEVDTNFCRNQVMWLIAEVLPLESGEWPPECKETGYTDIDIEIRTPSRPKTPREAVIGIRATIELRLSKTGRDGETLYHEVSHLNVYDYRELSQAAKDALNYVCGKKSKVMDYSRWLKQRERRKNGK